MKQKTLLSNHPANSPITMGDLRSALLIAAEAELAERGIEGFSLRSVAKRAGVSHAAPTHHFNDVNGLLTALAAEGFRQFQAKIEARQTAASSPQERAINAGFGYIAFATARPALFRLIFASSRPDYRTPELFAAAERSYHHLVDLVVDAGGGEEDILVFWSACHGMADLSLGQKLLMLASKQDSERHQMIYSALKRALPDPKTKGR
jgi:AcrR family transcriptional regulator